VVGARMVRAYVLFNVDAGSEDQVGKELRNIAEVQEVYVSYGVYDLIIKVAAESMEQLKEIITYRLRTIKNVRSTLTLIIS
jgi:DNA-binding Lrp family transcriptional regulator